MLLALGFSFLKVLPEATPAEKTIIGNWMKKGMLKVSLEYIRKNPGGNNHIYSSALGIMLVGITTDDQRLIDISSKVYQAAEILFLDRQFD